MNGFISWSESLNEIDHGQENLRKGYVRGSMEEGQHV